MQGRINRQIKWAGSHAWFIKADGNKVYCLDRMVDTITGNVSETVVFFVLPYSFKAMHDWAGY